MSRSDSVQGARNRAPAAARATLGLLGSKYRAPAARITCGFRGRYAARS
jgi:hypothetical protein